MIGLINYSLINYRLIKGDNFITIMQKWLDNNDILMYLTHSAGK